MQDQVHRRFLDIAAGLSKRLRDDIAAIGPLWFPERGDVDLSQFLCRLIVGQQLSTKAARSIWSRVVAVVEAGAGTVPAFFTAKNIAAIRGCGVSGNKTRALIHVAEAAAAGTLEGDAIRKLDHDARSARLKEIWGIGQWSCDMTSMFFCRDRDVWPLGDAAVSRVITRYVDGDTEAAAARFAPDRTILALYMWRIIDATPD